MYAFYTFTVSGRLPLHNIFIVLQNSKCPFFPHAHVGEVLPFGHVLNIAERETSIRPVLSYKNALFSEMRIPPHCRSDKATVFHF